MDGNSYISVRRAVRGIPRSPIQTIENPNQDYVSVISYEMKTDHANESAPMCVGIGDIDIQYANISNYYGIESVSN